MIQVTIHRTDVMAYIPEYKKTGLSGAELYACENMSIPPSGCAEVRTGIFFTIPNGFEGQLRNVRSLLRKHVAILGGLQTIDSAAETEITVLLFNASDKVMTIKLGTSIAQIVFAKVEQANFTLMKV